LEKMCPNWENPYIQLFFSKNQNYKDFSWTRAVFETCPKHPKKMSWTGMKNTTCPKSTPTFHGEWT